MFIYLAIIFLLIAVILVLLAYTYMKVTIGVCDSSKHLVGKVVVVTGGTSGIGYEAAVDLAKRGARVLVASNEPHGAAVRDVIAARSGNGDVRFIHLDLASLDSVRTAAAEILSREKRLDVLINNAGVLFTSNTKTEDGILLAMQINYLGPFLFTNLLLPLITRSSPARIINVASSVYKYGRVNLDNFTQPRTGCFTSICTYRDSKLCVALMSVELARRLQGTGVTVNFLHPGCTKTNIIKDHTFITHSCYKSLDFLLGSFFKTPRQGAHTLVHLAVSTDIENVSGCYFEECRAKEISVKASNKELSANLWCVSEKVVGLNKD